MRSPGVKTASKKSQPIIPLALAFRPRYPDQSAAFACAAHRSGRGCTSKITENMVRSRWTRSPPAGLGRRDTVDFDVEMAGPRRNIHENAGGRVFRKVPGINRIHGRELLDRGAIDVALEDV